MLVPQAIYTSDADALGAFQVSESLGSFGTKDFAGRPLPMGELLRASPAALSGRFARANDMSITKLITAGSVRLRISVRLSSWIGARVVEVKLWWLQWPGYADWTADIHAGPISSMAIQVAAVFKHFLTVSHTCLPSASYAMV